MTARRKDRSKDRGKEGRIEVRMGASNDRRMQQGKKGWKKK